MKNDEELFFKIEDYLSGNLAPEVAKAFERDIVAHPELAEMVEIQRFEREGMEFMMEEKLRAEVESWKTAPPNSTPNTTTTDPAKPQHSRHFRWKFWLLLLPLGIAGFFFFKKGQVSSGTVPGVIDPTESREKGTNPQTDTAKSRERRSDIPIVKTEKDGSKKQNVPENEYRVLASANYDLPVNLNGGLRDINGNEEKTILSTAIKSLDGDPADVRKSISEMQKIDRKSAPEAFGLAQEILAHAYFMDGQYDSASEIFETMTRQNLSVTAHDQAEWYLLLSLLPNYPQYKKRVDDLLKKMVDPTAYHEFNKKAINLKVRIDQISR